MKKLIIVILLFSVVGLFGQEKYYTKKKNNYLREGPGLFYPLVDIIPQGTPISVLKEKNNWLNIKFNGKVGWLSQSSISPKKIKKNISELAKKWSSSKVSKISIAGAIKGLKGKAGETRDGDFDRLLLYSHYNITPMQIMNFINELRLHKSENRNEVDFDDADLLIPEYDPDFKTIQIGYGVASRIAAQPLIINDNIRNYVYLIMNALLYESKFNDFDFNILILNKKQADGFSCPGGIIFITKGVFTISKDEAELAASIAHELGHQILQHGSRELSKRKTLMKADDMFAEMEGETNEETNEVESELNNLISDSYEKVVHTRTLKYELEADKFAAILLANAGYDPWGIVRLTSYLAKTFVAEKDIFSDDYLSPNDMLTRYRKIKEFVEDNFSKENPGAKLPNRFNKFYNLIQQ
jgi:hypothetical protein